MSELLIFLFYYNRMLILYCTVANTATILESGIPRTEDAACIKSTPMKADSPASIQAAPIKDQKPSTSGVAPPKHGTNSTIRKPASEVKKKDIQSSNKSPQNNKSSVTTSEGTPISARDKRKLKLNNKSFSSQEHPPFCSEIVRVLDQSMKN